MTTVYRVFVSDSEWFFHEDGTFITGWDCNDASYRDEYMGSLLGAFDIEVEDPPDDRYEDFLHKIVEERPSMEDFVKPYLEDAQ